MGDQRRRHTTILLLALSSSLMPLCCAFRVLVWWTTGGHVCSLLFEGKLIFWNLVDQEREHNLFHLCPDEPPLWNFKRLCRHVCVRFGEPRSTVWSLVLLRWCRMSGQVPLRRGHPPAGTHRAGCWTPLISLHCWLLLTPLLSASRAAKHHLSSMTPTKQHPPPQPSPLLHLIDFHQGPIFLALFPVAHLFWQTTRSSWWPLHLNYNQYETLSATLCKRQTTHTIASQSLSFNTSSMSSTHAVSESFWMAHLEQSV